MFRRKRELIAENELLRERLIDQFCCDRAGKIGNQTYAVYDGRTNYYCDEHVPESVRESTRGG